MRTILEPQRHYFEVRLDNNRCFYRCASAASCAAWRLLVDNRVEADLLIDPTEDPTRSWLRVMGEREQDLPPKSMAPAAPDASGGLRERQ